jgi:ATP-dependent DNA ligase
VKKFLDTEVKIIGYEEGTNKLAGTLGAFICEYKNNTVKVGSGLSDEDRAYFWANQDNYLNKYITVKYFEESYDSKTNLPSLRFPIYMRIREDL